MLEVRPDAVAFRHELARRAVEGSLPASERMRLNGRVLAALLRRTAPDLAAGRAPRGGRPVTTPRWSRTPRRPPGGRARPVPRARARRCTAVPWPAASCSRRRTRPPLSEAYAWALFNSGRRPRRCRAAADAVRAARGPRRRRRARAGRSPAWPCSSGRTCDRRPRWPRRAGRAAARTRRRQRRTRLGADLPGRGPDQPRPRAGRVGARSRRRWRWPSGSARRGSCRLALIYRGRARLQLGEEAGRPTCARPGAGPGDRGPRATSCSATSTWSRCCGGSAATPRSTHYLDEGAEYGRDRDFPTHDRGREAYRYRLLALRGDWEAAEAGLRALLGDARRPGVLARHALPGLARLAVRRGRDDARGGCWPRRADERRAGRQRLQALVPTAAAELEHAWLTGGAAACGGRRCSRRTEQRAAASATGASCCAGCAASASRPRPFAGCPEEFAAGLRGDWRAAAAAWERIGDPYERALELAESGEVEPHAGGAGGVRRARCRAGGGADPAAAAGARGVGGTARSAGRDPGQPGRTDRAAGGDPGPARATGGPTRRSPRSSCCRYGRWTTTSRPCCRSSVWPPARRRPPPRPTSRPDSPASEDRQPGAGRPEMGGRRRWPRRPGCRD